MLLKRMQSALARLNNESLHRRENRFAAYRTGGLDFMQYVNADAFAFDQELRRRAAKDYAQLKAA